MNLDDLERLARAATPGPWMLATSCSWRRYVGPDGRTVCEPVTYSATDRHPDLHFNNGGTDGPDAHYIAAADPTTILRLVEIARAAQRYADMTLDFEADDGSAWAALRLALEGLKGSTP